jgi:hypothetical protein
VEDQPWQTKESTPCFSGALTDHTWIVPVAYGTQQQTAIFSAILQLAQDFVETHGRSVCHSEIDGACVDVLAKISIAIASASVSMKDPGFREEAEWRLVYMSAPEFGRGFGRASSVRVAASGLTPYLDVKLLNRDGSREGLLPIREIVVGPTVIPELAAEGVRFLLDLHGHNEVHIVNSKIPLRN